MKKWVSVLLTLFLLTGCTGKSGELDRVMTLRAKLLGAQGCTFDAAITADYGDEIHTFRMQCESDGRGDLSFTVAEPESIAGISGTISGSGGKLTFDDTALAFPLLADDQVTPVSGLWLLVKTLRGGYVTSCGDDGELLRVSIDDSYEDDALHVDVWLQDDVPVRAEIVWNERRIISMDIENFAIL